MPDSISGSVYQRRGDGSWCAALTVNGKRKVVYAKSEREAKKALVKLQGETAKTGTLATSGTKTLDDLLAQFLATSKPHLKPRTFSEYAGLARRHIGPAIGRVRLSKLEPTYVQSLCNSLTASGRNRQAKLVFNLLHKALGMAVFWGWLPANICDRVIRPQYQPQRKEVWTGEQLSTFLEATRDHWLGPLFALAACSGCRVSELIGLTWADVDLARGTIYIGRGLHRIGGEWIESSPKSRSGERTIALPPQAIDALRHQKALQAAQRLRIGPAWDDLGLAFTGETGKPLHRAVIFHALQRECQRLGLPAIGIHQLRHAHASILIASGLPITAISQRLGHANASITMSVYAHALRNDDSRAADAIGQVLRGASNG